MIMPDVKTTVDNIGYEYESDMDGAKQRRIK